MDRLNTLTHTQTNMHIHTRKRKTFTQKFYIPDDSRFHSTGLEPIMLTPTLSERCKSI